MSACSQMTTDIKDITSFCTIETRDKKYIYILTPKNKDRSVSKKPTRIMGIVLECTKCMCITNHRSVTAHNYIYILLSLIWSANTVNSQSLKVLINTCHVQSFPFPVSHSSKIFVTILFGFPRNCSSMLFTSVPVLSLRRNVPNALYSIPTC